MGDCESVFIEKIEVLMGTEAPTSVPTVQPTDPTPSPIEEANTTSRECGTDVEWRSQVDDSGSVLLQDPCNKGATNITFALESISSSSLGNQSFGELGGSWTTSVNRENGTTYQNLNATISTYAYQSQ